MDAIEILNTIRDNASQAYQDRVPEATRSNLEEVGEAITDLNNAVVYNEFVNTLANMIYAPMLIKTEYRKLPGTTLRKLVKLLRISTTQLFTMNLLAHLLT